MKKHLLKNWPPAMFVVLAFFFGAGIAQGDEGWRILAASGEPFADRTHFSATAVGEIIYLFGGSTSGEPCNDLYRFEPASSRFERITATGELPPARLGHSAVAMDGRLYVYGGANAQWEPMNDLWIYDSTLNQWQQPAISGSQRAPKSMFHQAAVVNGRMILTGLITPNPGGFGSQPVSEVWCYDPSTAGWTQAAPFPGDPGAFHFGWPMAHPTISNRLVILGVEASRLHIYDLNADQWSEIIHAEQELPMDRGAASWKNRAFLLGPAGQANPSKGWATAYDFDKNEWQNLPALPMILLAPAAAVAPAGQTAATLFVFGGTSEAGIANSSVFALDLTDSAATDPGTQPPGARYGHSLAAVQGQLYLFGGAGMPAGASDDSSGPLLGELYRFDSSSNVFRRVTFGGTPPPAMMGHQAFVHQNQMGVLLGQREDSGDQDLYLFDPANSSWQRHSASSNAPAARVWSAGVVFGNDFVLYGGQSLANGERLADLWTFNLLQRSWTRRTVAGDAPQALSGHSLSAVNGTGYLFGGELATIDDETELSFQLYRFDPNSYSFARLSPLGWKAPGSGRHGSTTYGGAPHYFFGNRTTFASGSPLIYQPASNAWLEVRPRGSVPAPRKDTAIATLATKTYLFGGRSLDESVVYGDLWIFDHEKGTWAAIEQTSPAVPTWRIDVEPTSLDFGTVNAGYTNRQGAIHSASPRVEKSFILRNRGNQPVIISGLTVPSAWQWSWPAGENNLYFGSGEEQGLLMPWSSTRFYLTFNPLAPGFYTGQAIVDAAPYGLGGQLQGQAHVALSGMAAAPVKSKIKLSTNWITFGECPVGESRSAPIVIYNVGAEPVTIGGVTFSHAAYQAIGAEGIISPGESNAFHIVFKPDVPMAQLTTRAELMCDADEGGLVIGCSAKAVPATAELVFTPDRLDFGDAPVDTIKTMVLTLLNRAGNMSIRIAKVEMPEGFRSPLLDTVAGGVLELKVGEPVDMPIYFEPMRVSSFGGMVKVAVLSPNGGSAEMQLCQVSGIGLPSETLHAALFVNLTEKAGPIGGVERLRLSGNGLVVAFQTVDHHNIRHVWKTGFFFGSTISLVLSNALLQSIDEKGVDILCLRPSDGHIFANDLDITPVQRGSTYQVHDESGNVAATNTIPDRYLTGEDGGLFLSADGETAYLVSNENFNETVTLSPMRLDRVSVVDFPILTGGDNTNRHRVVYSIDINNNATLCRDLQSGLTNSLVLESYVSPYGKILSSDAHSQQGAYYYTVRNWASGIAQAMIRNSWNENFRMQPSCDPQGTFTVYSGQYTNPSGSILSQPQLLLSSGQSFALPIPAGAQRYRVSLGAGIIMSDNAGGAYDVAGLAASNQVQAWKLYYAPNQLARSIRFDGLYPDVSWDGSAVAFVREQPGSNAICLLNFARDVDSFVVTNLSDNGPGSLRQAILNANTRPGLDRVNVDFGQNWIESTVFPVFSDSILTLINDPIIIDGRNPGGGRLGIAAPFIITKNANNSRFQDVVFLKDAVATPAVHVWQANRVEFNRCEFRGVNLLLEGNDNLVGGPRASVADTNYANLFTGKVLVNGVNNQFYGNRFANVLELSPAARDTLIGDLDPLRQNLFYATEHQAPVWVHSYAAGDANNRLVGNLLQETYQPFQFEPPLPPLNDSSVFQNLEFSADRTQLILTGAFSAPPGHEFEVQFWVMDTNDVWRPDRTWKLAASSNTPVRFELPVPACSTCYRLALRDATANGNTCLTRPAAFYRVNMTNDAQQASLWPLDSNPDTPGPQLSLRDVLNLYRHFSEVSLVYLDVPVIHVGWMNDGYKRGLPPATSPIFIQGRFTADGTPGTLLDGRQAEYSYLSGSSDKATGLQLWGNGHTLRGVWIGGFPREGLYLMMWTTLDFKWGPTRILGNWIGDPHGTFGDRMTNGNWGVGVLHRVCPGIQIGDGTPAGRNVISGNEGGIWIRGESDTAPGNVTIAGNYIGVTASGLAASPNWMEEGLVIQNTKGTLVLSNCISGNAKAGLRLLGPATRETRIHGNTIGLDAFGLYAIPNQAGIQIEDALQNVLGGSYTNLDGLTQSGTNLIAGNRSDGIVITGGQAMLNRIEGNIIGLNRGQNPDSPGNGGSGIRVASPNNTIGSSIAGRGNVIGNNAGPGVLIESDLARGNALHGNRIGAIDDRGSASYRPNGAAGICLANGAGASYIGVFPLSINPLSNAASANLIAGNQGPGIALASSAGPENLLTGNRIFANNGLPIDLMNDNRLETLDVLDADTGPNNRMNPPILTNATLWPQPGGRTNIVIRGHVLAGLTQPLRLEFYSHSAPNGASRFLGMCHIQSDSDGLPTGFRVIVPQLDPAGNHISALCIDRDTGDTSELSLAAQAQPPTNEKDSDGVPDQVEDRAPNGGDANRDGIKDSEQANVSSFPLPRPETGYATLEAPAGLAIGQVSVSSVGETEPQSQPSPGIRAASVPAFSMPDSPPAGWSLPIGFLSFTIEGTTPGLTNVITLRLPEDLATHSLSYFAFGPEPGQPAAHWFEFLQAATRGLGAQIQSNVISLHLCDGAWGDLDSANGSIQVAGGPAERSEAPSGPSYADWIAAYNLVSNQAMEGADPDGDGIVNFAEYALGLNPAVRTRTGLPRIERVANGYQLVFDRPRNRPSLQYLIERSADLIHWTPIEAAAVITAIDEQTDWVTVPLSPGNATLFLRIRVTY